MVREVLMWPSVVLNEVKTGNFVAPALGLAATTYFVGLPSADMDFYDMAMWYTVTGAGQAVALRFFPGRSVSMPVGFNPPSKGADAY